jgi:hypothetical protein
MVMESEAVAYLLNVRELESSAAQPTYAQLPSLSPTAGLNMEFESELVLLLMDGCTEQTCCGALSGPLVTGLQPGRAASIPLTVSLMMDGLSGQLVLK